MSEDRIDNNGEVFWIKSQNSPWATKLLVFEGAEICTKIIENAA